MIELSIEFILGNLCVYIEIWDKKEKQFKRTAALFDTGAHTTHIDTNALKRLGYNLDNAKEDSVSTVGSRNLKVHNTVIDNIKIGELELGAVLVKFSELSDINAPAVILGMNVIKEFNINLDFENEIMSLNPNFDADSALPVEKFHRSSSRFGMWTIGVNKNI